ncbi:MAG: hypothetical protein AB1757_30600 [Acidobacteriota bacterium]
MEPAKPGDWSNDLLIKKCLANPPDELATAVTKSELAPQDELEPFKRLRTILSSRIRQVLEALPYD